MNPMHKFLAAAALAVGLAGTLAAQPAHAQVNISGVVHVRLPGGEVISVRNTPDRPWWRDRRVAVYNRYVFDPVQRVYVIHDYDRYPVRYVRYDRHHPPYGHAWGHYKHRGHDRDERHDHDHDRDRDHRWHH